MIKRFLGRQSEQPKQQLTPAKVDGAESGNNVTIRAFRHDMARVREVIEALTRRFGEWFATNSLFREISVAIATQTVIWLVVETLLLNTLKKDFGNFCSTFKTQLENRKLVINYVMIEDMNDELTCPKGGVLIVGLPTKGKRNPHYHILVYFDGVEVYSRRNLSPKKDHTKMAQEAANKVLQEWEKRNPKVDEQKPNTRKRK
jgi:hypothetical protein